MSVVRLRVPYQGVGGEHLSGRGKRKRGPRVVYRSSCSDTPGSQDELEKILFRWELTLARRIMKSSKGDERA